MINTYKIILLLNKKFNLSSQTVLQLIFENVIILKTSYYIQIKGIFTLEKLLK